MGRILVVDDHDSLRKGLVRALANAGHDVEEAAERHGRDRAAAGQPVRRRADRPAHGRRRRHGRAAHDAIDPAERGGDPDDGVRVDPHGRRGDEDRRVRLRAEAVRDRGDGAQDREGDRAPAPQVPGRVPAPRAAGHLRLRPHRRRERRAAAGADASSRRWRAATRRC